MGLGKLFGGSSGPSVTQQTVDKIQAANQQILANNQQASSAPPKASSVLPALTANAGKTLAPSNAASALGILDFIKTTPSGLSNDNKKGGKLTVLGN